jgi:hypothetical protein
MTRCAGLMQFAPQRTSIRRRSSPRAALLKDRRAHREGLPWISLVADRSAAIVVLPAGAG